VLQLLKIDLGSNSWSFWLGLKLGEVVCGRLGCATTQV